MKATKRAAVDALQEHAAAMRTTLNDLEAETNDATAKINEWKAIQHRIQDNLAKAPDSITLDVGGAIFKTTKQTLLRVEDSYFQALLGSDTHDTAGGPYFLDLDPDCFRHVLKFLRTGKMKVLNGLSSLDRDDVNMAMEYLKLAPPSETPQSHVWGDYGCCMARSSDWKTVESVTPLSSTNTALVQQPLVGSIQLEVAAVEEDDALFWIGLSAAPHGDLSSWESSKSCICYWSDGNVHKFDRREAFLPKIKEDDRVTIRRGRTHVEFQLNADAPFNIDLPDPTIELFPTFAVEEGEIKVTILD